MLPIVATGDEGVSHPQRGGHVPRQGGKEINAGRGSCADHYRSECFLCNVPIGDVAWVLAARYLPDLRLNRRQRLDWPGTVLASLGLFLVCAGLVEGPSHHWASLWGPVGIPALIGTGVAVLLVFVWQQRRGRDREPLVPAELFADRNLAVMCGVVAAISFHIVSVGQRAPMMGDTTRL